MLTFGKTLFVMSLPVGDTVLVVEAEADLEAEAEADEGLRFPLLLATVAVASGGDISPPS